MINQPHKNIILIQKERQLCLNKIIINLIPPHG